MEIDLDEIRGWAADAGAIARQHFNHTRTRRKADHSWVTEADELIEQMLVERITARYPEHGIIGEEQTRRDTSREFLWALDPIDGTGAFVNGLPTWGVSIGLMRAGAPFFGLLYMPLLEDYYWAYASGEAFLNGERIKVAAGQEWDTEDWISVPSDSHHDLIVDFPGKSRALGCTIMTISYVARGSAVGGVFDRVSIWDVAAGMAILQAAGGVAVDLEGQPLDVTAMLDGKSLTKTVLIGSPDHAQALREVIHDRPNV